MNIHEASSCLRFMESMRDKMQQLMNTGDIVSHEQQRKTPEEVSALVDEAKIYIADGYSIKKAAKEVGLHWTTLHRRLKLDEK